MKSALTGYLGVCAAGWCDQNLPLAIRGGGHSAAGTWDAIDRLCPGSVYVNRNARFGGMVDRHIARGHLAQLGRVFAGGARRHGANLSIQAWLITPSRIPATEPLRAELRWAPTPVTQLIVRCAPFQ